MTFAELACYFRKLEDTPSRNTMTEILADLFRHAEAREIGELCYLLQGRVVPLYEAVEFGIADKLMIRAIAQAYGVEEKKVSHEFKKVGDLGVVAEGIKNKELRIKKKKERQLTVLEIFKQLYDIALASGEGSQEKKITILANVLQRIDSLSARYIARIPLDKLRLGFSDMTMLDALSWMMHGDKSLRQELERAYNVYPDIGYIAKTVKEHGIDGLSHVKANVGAPILASLCQRIPNAHEMIEKMCRLPDQSVGGRASSTEASGGMVAVEPKYDGVRVEIHWEKSKVKSQKSKVSTFSRNLENTTAMFPELEHIGHQLNASEVILDSEAVGIDPKTGRIVPFQETVTRKRKHDIQGAQKAMPLRFYVFDILIKDGVDLLNTPLSKRRAILEKTIKPGNILCISPQIVTDSPKTLRDYHNEQLKKGLEGVVVKKWESPYEPGRRGFSWVKFKEEEGKTGKLTDTIDAVIMGYSRGEGKRSTFGIGMFLVGVKKGESFVTITKIGTGVSDELWKDIHTQLHAIKTSNKPPEYLDVPKTLLPDVWVVPKIVVEIAGDDLTRSPNHGAGFAVRFPRLVRIRSDKSPSQVTTVSEVKRMFNNQGNNLQH